MQKILIWHNILLQRIVETVEKKTQQLLTVFGIILNSLIVHRELHAHVDVDSPVFTGRKMTEIILDLD